MADQITHSDVAAHYGDLTLGEVPGVIDAVNGMVTQWHGETWPPGVHLGAVMLAARLYRRRNSPAGVESFTDMGASYVARYDSDLDRQLRINGWLPPRVG